MKADFESYCGKITVNGETFECYIYNIEFRNIDVDFVRDINGRLKRKIITKRKFTLFEV